MTINEIREKFINYYIGKDHAEIASSSLLPKNDPTTLFTGSGMQQLMPYLLGEEHKKGVRLVDSQKCFRAEDIDEVGDNRHTTFFEMLGNWSLGDYFKEDQLSWIFNFLIDELGIDPKRLYVTVFSGDKSNNIPKDDDSVKEWQKLFEQKGIDSKSVEIGSEANGYKVGMQNGRIFYYDASKNWWSRAGVPANMPAGEPGGPDSEMFYEFTEIKHDKKWGENCHPNCDCGRFMEIGNSVFMQYIKNEDGTFSKLPKQNVDFGGGLERMAAAAANDPDVFNIDIFAKIIADIEEITGIKYSGASEDVRKSFRVLCDHLRAATFLASDGVKPSNLGQGYVLRRLIRRAIRYAKLAAIFEQKMCSKIADSIISDYQDHYKNLGFARESILAEFDLEEAKFLRTLEAGTKEFERLVSKGCEISAYEAFELFATHGFPFEMTKEMAQERGIKVDEQGFQTEFEKHQEISRAGANEKKFAGGLENKDDPKIVQYHTAAHLLLAALKEVLGDSVRQKGANITADRLRFDFSWSEKMTEDQKKAVEIWVNDKIAQKMDVIMTEMNLDEAKKSGAEGEFASKYGDKVKVYTVGSSSTGSESRDFVSREICGGPHVHNTSELGHFRIKKEESSSSGVRRIKAVLQ
jgi:alanyl-tRNA synthetase